MLSPCFRIVVIITTFFSFKKSGRKTKIRFITSDSNIHSSVLILLISID